MLGKVVVVGFAALLLMMAAAILYGIRRWESETKELYAKMEAVRVPIVQAYFDPGELEGLPAPVQRYFRIVLKKGQPLIRAVNVEHAGTFNMSETGEQWKSFRSSQRVIVRRPGFVWDARIRMTPGINVHVHDAYVAGEGVLTAKLFGLVTVMKQPGSSELARGELMRFFAEAAWYPTALLPSQGVCWEEVDAGSARATLVDGELSLTMLFTFSNEGLIETVRTEDRGRISGDQIIFTPWQGRFWDYHDYNGMLIPLDGEAAWLMPEGAKPYWRGRIQRIEHEMSHSKSQ
ncbi:MAG: DUF6544 family protein [Desulfosoma sp.]